MDTWQQFIEELVQLQGRSKATAKNYICAYRKFRGFTNKPLPDISTVDLTEFAKSLTIGESTKSLYLDALSSFFKWAKRRKFISENPFDDLARIRPEAPAPRAFKWSEGEVYIENAQGKLNSPRDKMLLTMLLHTGARISEILNLTLNDVDMDERSVILTKTKGRKVRVVYLNKRVSEQMVDYLEWKRYHMPESNWLFPTRFGRQMRIRDAHGIRKRYGIPVKLHQFRHTFATELLRRTHNIAVVSNILGHSSLAVTSKYMTVFDEDKRAAADALENKQEGLGFDPRPSKKKANLGTARLAVGTQRPS